MDADTFDANIIKDSDRVIFQRKDWSKDGIVGHGKSLVISKLKTKTDDIVGLAYGTLVEWNKHAGKFERVEEGELEDDDFTADVEDGETGGDNRNLVDNSTAQSLTTGEITAMKAQGVKGKEIIDSLVQNSLTFETRQEYAKEKYIQKKKDKHVFRFRILRPTLRLVCEVYGCGKPQRINYLRLDTLAIMLSNSNIHAGSNVMVVDGVQGLLLAAAMERMGGRGKIVHVHPGPQPIIPAYEVFGFPEEWTRSIYHLSIDNLEVISPTVEILQNGVEPLEISEPPVKRRKLNDAQQESARFIKNHLMDSLMIASKHHPKTILLFLLPFLGLSRNFVVHSSFREPLVETFQAVRSSGRAVRVCLNETWLRLYQVLPSRTHPENNMSGSGGYLLSGTTVEKDSSFSDGASNETARNFD
ncbi:hypothetical protein RvY_10257 [Ramazzottius varieornatus]|uniref:tRNA (adenine(58)-N(1))-methyltransferase non-catalytic subunit TRM6 n=1 Tax=Ramazzottius varieornatus TaxID=947166 RepID=A0A1D1VEM4_RAMVA|nr:hypothetical protein RvY_10257 [Ramazzottius varieornatus]